MAKRSRQRLRGGEIQRLRPDWRPLLDLAPAEIPDFMWMFRVALEGERTVEAYKHSWTRQYLHLDHSGHAYVFRGEGWYEEVDPQELLEDVLGSVSSARYLAD